MHLVAVFAEMMVAISSLVHQHQTLKSLEEQVFGRIRDAIAAGNSAVAHAETDFDRDTLAWLCLDPQGDTLPGLDSAFRQVAKRQNLRPLKILSCLSAPEHPNLNANCEFLALPEDIFEATHFRTDAMVAYTSDRLQMIFSKWTVRTCVWSGAHAADLLTQTSNDHFVGTVILPFHRLEK